MERCVPWLLYLHATSRIALARVCAPSLGSEAWSPRRSKSSLFSIIVTTTRVTLRFDQPLHIRSSG
jgi:hypothetical protein